MLRYVGAAAGCMGASAIVWKALAGSMAWLTGWGLLIVAARISLERLMSSRATRTVAWENIEPGMIPSKRGLALLRGDPEYFETHFDPLFKDGLSAAQAEALKQWLRGWPKEQASIEVVGGIPFAAWILSGALFTLAARLDAANLLMYFLRFR